MMIGASLERVRGRALRLAHESRQHISSAIFKLVAAMAGVLSFEERKRRSRNIVFAAFIVLIFIWTVKLSLPQTTILSIYSSHTSSPTSTGPAHPTATSKWKPKPTNTATILSVNGTDTSKAAVIVETRFRTNLIPLILHFSSVLGPSWPIIIYTSIESMSQFSTSAALARYIKLGTISIRMLPQTVLFTNSDSVNRFMTETWLWESLTPAEHVLIFQSDSMLCANAARSVEDYFMYDLVGAPIKRGLGKGYNGGLSLRKRSTILKVLEKWTWDGTEEKGDRFEDQWYFNRMEELQQEDEKNNLKPEDEGAINLPSMEVARTFSVETIDYPHPLGVHQVHRWLKEQMLSLDEWCPEYKLCSEDHIVDTKDS